MSKVNLKEACHLILLQIKLNYLRYRVKVVCTTIAYDLLTAIIDPFTYHFRWTTYPSFKGCWRINTEESNKEVTIFLSFEYKNVKPNKHLDLTN